MNWNDLSIAEFIAGVKDGSYNEDNMRCYCSVQSRLIPLFRSLHDAATTLIQSKGNEGRYVWNLTERRFDFDNPKDMRLYFDVEFVRLQDAMGIVCNLIDKQPFQDNKENSMTPDERAAKTIPKWDKAEPYFAKAINVGLMNDSYQWQKGLQMLACFVRDLSDKLELGKGYNSNGQRRTSWKPFEEFFNIDKGRLRLNYNDIQKTGQNPNEINLINKVFE